MSRWEESRQDSGLKQVKASPLLLWAQPESEQQLLGAAALLPPTAGGSEGTGASPKIQLSGSLRAPEEGIQGRQGLASPLFSPKSGMTWRVALGSCP